MLFTVSTVKDSLANLTGYVERNLAAGADHLFVFLDAPDPEVEAYLTTHPQVSHTVTDATYWTPERPSSLNARQVTNANLAMQLLAGLEGSHWLFHIDADEVLQIDRDRLEQLGPEVRVVRLAPLEAVSQMRWGGEVSHFKKMLPRPQINDLVARGLIPAPEEGEPANGSYFRGHVQGKIGVRPSLDLRMQLHRVVYAVNAESDGDEVLPAYDAPWLEHLHFESHSGEEFVRKWMAHLGAGEVRFRPRRGRLRGRIESIVADSTLDAAGRRDALTVLYREQIEDDFEALRDLGVLVEPVRADRRPRALDPAIASDLHALWQLLLTSDKRFANPQLPERTPVAGFEGLQAEADPQVRPPLERALTAGRASASARGVGYPAPGPGGKGLLGRLRGRRG